MANVDSGAVQKATQLCRQSIDSLDKASKDIQSKYQQAGSGWKDAKYNQLGGIVGDCVSALRGPINQLRECMTALSNIAAAIGDYEGVNFSQ